MPRLPGYLAERQQWIDEYKLRHGCALCGYKEFARALDLDHIEPTTKSGEISRLVKDAPWQKVLDEIAKCMVLCAIHHRIKTFDPEMFMQLMAERRRPDTSPSELPGLLRDKRITSQVSSATFTATTSLGRLS
jgi:hypothetical protein